SRLALALEAPRDSSRPDMGRVPPGQASLLVGVTPVVAGGAGPVAPASARRAAACRALTTKGHDRLHASRCTAEIRSACSDDLASCMARLECHHKTLRSKRGESSCSRA